MILARFLSDKDQIHYGVVHHQDDHKARVVEGNIFNEYTITEKFLGIKKLLTPVIPPNIFAIGVNYRKHAQETGLRYPKRPIMFLKATSSLIGPEDPIVLPKIASTSVDFEGELAVVIGKKAKNVPIANAMNYVLGYTCANDVSARDWQIYLQQKQWARGKSFDSFCPVGPTIVCRDEIANPNRLNIKTVINDQVVQNSNTADMIFDVATLVSDLSQSLTLLPGSLILTGTPEGVGFTREPPRYLQPEDTVMVIIEGLGCLKNPVAMEK